MENYSIRYLLVKNSLSVLSLKCEKYRRMVERKMPHREELIDSFEFSRTECIEALSFLHDVDKEFTVSRQRAFDLETICMKLERENAELKKVNEELIKKVEI